MIQKWPFALKEFLFMNDGEISAHLNLGKYDRFTAGKREALLNKWLQNLGF